MAPAQVYASLSLRDERQIARYSQNSFAQLHCTKTTEEIREKGGDLRKRRFRVHHRLHRHRTPFPLYFAV